MLTHPERILFIILALVCGYFSVVGFRRIFRIIRRGRGEPRREGAVGRLAEWLVRVGLQQTILQTRRVAGVFHAFIFFGFSFYALVNVFDLLEGFTGFSTLYRGGLWGVYNLLADVLSVLVLVGMLYFLVRRFVGRPESFTFNEGVVLHPKARAGIPKDSLIVGGFILLHVGSRFVGQAFRIAEAGPVDPSQPLASVLAGAFAGLSPTTLSVGIHATWWLALGLILVFFPYFPRSKHLHLFVAPLNLALGRHEPLGALQPAGIADAGPSSSTSADTEPLAVSVDRAGPASVNDAGAATLTDLRWNQLVDPFACIMCNRCQDVCPVHVTGGPLSPGALEINKRYTITEHFAALAEGTNGSSPLLGTVISAEAVWACTTCAACVQICPVGNEPMRDIIDIRRRLVLEGEELDAGLQDTLMSLARRGNSFGQSSRKRARWIKGLDFAEGMLNAEKTPVEYLWYVGDYASYDPRGQEVSRAVARVFYTAGLDVGIMYRGEKSAGNDARRTGEEGLFELLVEQNVEALAKCDFQKIVTTDPHTLNTLRHEYPSRNGRYQVLHYTEVLEELIAEGRLALDGGLDYRVTYHDPCYLGRYNGVYEPPRRVLRALGVELVEMPRNREQSFCCGAGGGRIWMEDEGAGERPSENRIREAASLDRVTHFVVACPKDLVMFSDAVKTAGLEERLQVVDIIQLVEEAMGT